MSHGSTPSHRKPFWIRKRCIAPAVLWLVLAYPLSIGPVVYVAARGWYLPGTEVEIAFWPLLQVLRDPMKYGSVCHYYRDYVRLFETLAAQHRE
jgi:hypothetical protein